MQNSHQSGSGSGNTGASAGVVLKPEALQLVLEEATSPSVFCCMLMSTSGELISCAGDRTNEDLVAAIMASVWKTYERGGPSGTLKTTFIHCEQGVVACTQVLSKVIVCLVADREMELGLLKAKLEALRAHLAGPLTPVFQTAA